ncbi:MAG: hypothetical protein J1F41_01015 [Lachnospiraceae bacterium]|nr:hypothetical protein [Lachnospiraceae bacterium]
MYDLIDILCILSGGYLVYAALVMKLKGRIVSNVVLSKSMDENAIRDKEGLIRYLYGKLLFFGCIIILSSIANLVNEHMAGPGIVTVITCCIFAIAIVGYGVVTNRALKKYTK